MTLIFRRWLYQRLTQLIAILGSTIRDARTGDVLGKAILLPWRGKLIVIGYTGQRYFYPVFKLQKRATYWRQEIEFRTHPDPDEPSTPATESHDRDAQSASDAPGA